MKSITPTDRFLVPGIRSLASCAAVLSMLAAPIAAPPAEAAEMAAPRVAPASQDVQEPEAPPSSEGEAAEPERPASAPELPRTRDEVEVPEGATTVNIGGFGVAAPKERPEVETPEGGWLVDEETGRRYTVKRLSKEEDWSWLDEQKGYIRVGPVEMYQVEKELDDAFIVRVYHPQEGTGWQMPKPPTEEEIAATAASFEAATPESDRLRFASISRGLPTRGQWRNGFDVADMNGDGHLDIVHGPARKGGPGTPVILLGDGEGGWQNWREARFPTVRYSYGDLRVADFDGDGHLDIALGQHLQGVLAMLGDGAGNFRLANAGLPWEMPGEGGAAGGFSSRSLAIDDWNGDGRPDILALGEGPRPARDSSHSGGGGARTLLPSDSYGVAVFLNQFGDGTGWRSYDQGLDSGRVFGDGIATADFDRDGRLDFVVGSNVFGRRNLIGYGVEGGGWRSTEVEELRSSAFTKAVAVADFDGDGRDDLAVSQVANQAERWWSVLDVLYARADGWQRRTLHSEEKRGGYVSDLATGDVDGDGTADLVAVTEDGVTRIYLNDGGGFFTLEQSPEIEAMLGGCTGYHVAIADVDGDGLGEVIEAWAGEPSAMFAPDRCPTLGAIRAWDPAPAEAVAEADSEHGAESFASTP